MSNHTVAVFEATDITKRGCCNCCHFTYCRRSCYYCLVRCCCCMYVRCCFCFRPRAGEIKTKPKVLRSPKVSPTKEKKLSAGEKSDGETEEGEPQP